MIDERIQHLTQLSVYEKISGWMEELFEHRAVRLEKTLGYCVLHGSAAANVRVFPWGETDTIIHVWSEVTEHSAMTGELAFSLISENVNMVFGAFAINDAGVVIFKHNLLGSTCDKDELEHAVRAVAQTADKYGGEIKASWGGMRFVDFHKQ